PQIDLSVGLDPDSSKRYRIRRISRSLSSNSRISNSIADHTTHREDKARRTLCRFGYAVTTLVVPLLITNMSLLAEGLFCALPTLPPTYPIRRPIGTTYSIFPPSLRCQ